MSFRVRQPPDAGAPSKSRFREQITRSYFLFTFKKLLGLFRSNLLILITNVAILAGFLQTESTAQRLNNPLFEKNHKNHQRGERQKAANQKHISDAVEFRHCAQHNSGDGNSQIKSAVVEGEDFAAGFILSVVGNQRG